MSAGVWVLIVAVVLAVVFGCYRVVADGRFRGTHRVRGVEDDRSRTPAGVSVLAGTAWEQAGGERFTLLQFSSAFCAPCRATRRVLEDVSGSTPGVAHLEVDAEQHLALVRRLGILRTPTTLILDGQGRELGRATGVPTKPGVLVVLGES